MKIENKNSKRIFYYDALKALAIVGVIFCHIGTVFAGNMKILNTNEWYFSIFFHFLNYISIPIFVMVSGALLVNKDYKTKIFIKKKFNRIFIPFIFWVIIYILFAAITVYLNLKLGKINHISLDVIIKIILGTSGYARVYWFIWMILVVYISLFIINKIIKNSKIENIDSKIFKSILVLFVIYSVIVSLNLFNPMDYTFIYYLSFVGYGILGYYLSKVDFTKYISKKKILISSLILSILSYAIILLNIILLTNNTGELTGISHFHILKIILASSMLLFFRYLDEYDGTTINSIHNKIKTGKIGKLIISLGVCSFGIYLSHMIFKNFYVIYVFHSIKLVEHSPSKWIPFIFILVLLTSWAIIWIMSKIPYIKKVSGV